ncbi:hypothetical protein ColKHC_05559 [Colletotrichum higginsianum]|nr:hypothetical protein ColKHC_05559 [Colletotrichum higginsianum]
MDLTEPRIDRTRLYASGRGGSTTGFSPFTRLVLKATIAGRVDDLVRVPEPDELVLDLLSGDERGLVVLFPGLRLARVVAGPLGAVGHVEEQVDADDGVEDDDEDLEHEARGVEDLFAEDLVRRRRRLRFQRRREPDGVAGDEQRGADEEHGDLLVGVALAEPLGPGPRDGGGHDDADDGEHGEQHDPGDAGLEQVQGGVDAVLVLDLEEGDADGGAVEDDDGRHGEEEEEGEDTQGRMPSEVRAQTMRMMHVTVLTMQKSNMRSDSRNLWPRLALAR